MVITKEPILNIGNPIWDTYISTKNMCQCIIIGHGVGFC